MKKTTSKPATALAPAKQAPSAPAKKSATPKPATKTKKNTAPKPAVKSVKVGKASAATPAGTVITARIDIGFGNALHLRGEGPGLSWDKGVPLRCLGDDQWMIEIGETARPVIFKFLVNDLTWSAGPDYIVTPGAAFVAKPDFEE